MRAGLPPMGMSTSSVVPCFSLMYLATSWPKATASAVLPGGLTQYG